MKLYAFEKHGADVRAEINREHNKSLYNIPLADLIRSTTRALLAHPAFHVVENRYSGKNQNQIVPRKARYTLHEIGNYLFADRVTSELVAKRLISPVHIELFKRCLGRRYYNPPSTEYDAQLRALRILEKKFGKKKVNDLLKRAREIYLHESQKLDKISGDDENIRLSGDAFANPMTKHNLISSRMEQTTDLGADDAVLGEVRRYLQRHRAAVLRK